MSDYEVLYRALADFSQLTTEAAKARATMADLRKEAQQLSDTETRGASTAAAAHKADATEINAERQAMEKAIPVAEAYNRALAGGRDPSSVVQGIQAEASAQDTLNKAKQRGFSTPQQDLQFRQQEIQTQNAVNKATQAGYSTPEQYLAYLSGQRRALDEQATALARRNALLQQSVPLLSQQAQATTGHKLDTSGFTLSTQAASGLQEALSGLDSTSASPSVGLDSSTFFRTSAEVQAELDRIARERIEPSVGLDAGRAKAELDDIYLDIRTLSRAVASPDVKVNETEFLIQVAEIKAALEALDRHTTVANIQVAGTDRAKAAFTDLQRAGTQAFGDIEARSDSSNNRVTGGWRGVVTSVSGLFRNVSSSAAGAAENTEGSFRKAGAGITSAFRTLAGGGGIGNVFTSISSAVAGGAARMAGSLGPLGILIASLITFLPALTAGLGALSGVLAAVPGLFFAAGAGVGALIQVFHPVVKVLGDYAKAQQAAGQSSAQAGQTAVQAAGQQHAVADAYYAVQQAAYQARQSQITNAHAVQDAQFSLQEAVKSQADQQITSSEQIAASQHSLQQAIFSVAEAQKNLNQAWVTATRALEDLREKVQFGSLDLKGAQLSLQDAQANYNKVLANSASTALERAQALYQVQVAEKNLKDVVEQNKRNREDLNKAEKDGAKGSRTVVDAQHALAEAQYNVVQAQKNVIDVQRQAAEAQIQSAHAVAEATYNLARAQEAQKQGFLTSAHAQAEAAFGLSQALATARLGAGTSATAQNAYNAALAKLSPAAREAVHTLLDLWKAWKDNKDAQEAFFRNANPGLKALKGDIEPVQTLLTRVAGALGTVTDKALEGFSKFAQSPAWAVLTRGTVAIVNLLGDAAVRVAHGFADIAVAAVPFTTWLVRGVDNLAKRFENWAEQAAKPGSAFRKWLLDIRPILVDFGHFLSAIVQGFRNLADSFSPGNTGNLKAFGDILQVLSTAVLPALFQFLSALATPQLQTSLIKLFGALATLISTIISSPGFVIVLNGALRALTGIANILTDVASWKPAGIIIGGIAAALVTIAGLSFAGAGIMKMIEGLKSVRGVIGRLTGGRLPGFPGGEGGAGAAGAAAPLDASAERLTGAAVALDEAAAALKVSAGAEGGLAAKGGAAAGGAVSAEEGAAGGAAAGAGAARGARFLRGGIALALADILARAGVSAVPKASDQSLRAVGTGGTAGSIDRTIFGSGINNVVADINKNFSHPIRAFFYSDVEVPVRNFFARQLPDFITSTIPRWFDAAKTWFMRDVTEPVGAIITQTIPHFFDTTIPQWFDSARTWFRKSVMEPLGDFITKSIPHFFDTSIPQWFDSVRSWFRKDVALPLGNFITDTIPHFFDTTIPKWFDSVRTWFRKDVMLPLGNFITESIPHFFDSTIPKWFDSVGGWFTKQVVQPIGKWFTSTLPAAIEQSFKGSINWVIGKINTVIGFIDNDILGHLPGNLKISKIQQLAVGGSVAGSGDADKTPIMATPGEWVVRKAARMALDREFGPEFLPGFINQADRVLPRRAMGGPVPSSPYGLAFAGGGSIPSVQKFIQATDRLPYVWGGVGPGSYDCSGLTGEVYAKLLGLPDFQRYFVTQSDFQSLGFKKGLGTYTIGVNPATHMVGNLAGLKFEARGTDSGIITGPQATDVRSMQEQWHLAEAGDAFVGNGGGFLSGLGNFLGGLVDKVVSPVKHLVSGLFDVGWDAGVKPILNTISGAAGGTFGGDLMLEGMDRIHDGVHNALRVQDGILGAPGGDPGMGVVAGSFKANQALGKQMAAARGWTGPKWSALNALEIQEAGWNPFATNPDTGAFGIPQALPRTKMNLAAQHGNVPEQIKWMYGYIDQRYRNNPIVAEDHEQAFGWYAAGGPVGDIQEFPGGPGSPVHGRPVKRPPPTLQAQQLMKNWIRYRDIVKRRQYREEDAYQGFRVWDRGPGGMQMHPGISGGGAMGPADLKKKHPRIYQQVLAARKILIGEQREELKDFRKIMRHDPRSLRIADWGGFGGKTQQLINTLNRDMSLFSHSDPAAARGWLRELNSERDAQIHAREAWRRLYDALPGTTILGGFTPGTPGAASNPYSIAPPSVPGLASLLPPGPDASYSGGMAVPSQFALGGPVSLPALSSPDIRNAVTSAGAGGQGSGSMSQAAMSAGGGSSFNVENINIHNPVQERAGDSLTRSVNKLAFLAGRGG